MKRYPDSGHTCLSWILVVGIFLSVFPSPGRSSENQSEQSFVQVDAAHVHRSYLDNAVIPPFFGKGTADRIVVYGDYVPVYLSKPERFDPYPTSPTPYEGIFDTAQEVLDAANDSEHEFHDLAVLSRDFAESILEIDQNENDLHADLSQKSLVTAVNELGNISPDWNGLPPSSLWTYKQKGSLQEAYKPDSLMNVNENFIAPKNQWNSVTYNPAEEYIEAFDQILHPVPDMSFLEDVANRQGPMWELGSALADVANPYTFLPSLLLMGFDLYQQSQKEFEFFSPTLTSHEIAVLTESGLIMLKNGDQQMAYTITGGQTGSFTEMPSGDAGIMFLQAVNTFGGGIRPTAELTNHDFVQGSHVHYNQVPQDYKNLNYSLNLESHVGVGQSGKWLYDTVACRIQGAGRLVLIPFKIGCRIAGDSDHVGDALSKVIIGIRFKNSDKIHSATLSDCLLENAAGAHDTIGMWSGTIIFDAFEYGQQKIEEVFLTAHSGAFKTSGANRFRSYTTLSFSPYFLEPICTVPENIEVLPGETVAFQTEILNQPANATLNIQWRLPQTGEILEDTNASYVFDEPGDYPVELIIDPEYSESFSETETIGSEPAFWNSPTGQIVWPFQVRVIAPFDIDVDWDMPSCFALNTTRHEGTMSYPNRSSAMTFRVSNQGSHDYIAQAQSTPPIRLEFLIDRNDDEAFSQEELVWQQDIDRLNAQEEKSFSLEHSFALDKPPGGSEDEMPVYPVGEHLCMLRAGSVTQEVAIENNTLQKAVGFLKSPELIQSDFLIESAQCSIDSYQNLDVTFSVMETCQDITSLEAWNKCHPLQPYSLQWGLIPYSIELDQLHGTEEWSSSHELETIAANSTRNIFKSMNVSSLSPGEYTAQIVLNPKNNPHESSNGLDNIASLGNVYLNDARKAPWYTRGGDRERSFWKKSNLKPPLVTDWSMDVSGTPVSIVCSSQHFFVLTEKGRLEKYSDKGEQLFSATGYDGHPIDTVSLMLLDPEGEASQLLAYTQDNRLAIMETSDGGRVWESQKTFRPTVNGNDERLAQGSRCLDYDGRYLLAGFPLTLYRFGAGIEIPELLWQHNRKIRGDAFLVGDRIITKHRVFNRSGEEIDYIGRLSCHPALRLGDTIYSNSLRYYVPSGTSESIEVLEKPLARYAERILTNKRSHLQCFSKQGQLLWKTPEEVPRGPEKVYFDSQWSQNLKLSINTRPLVLGDGAYAYAYCINHDHLLLAIDLENGQPVWYREFAADRDSFENWSSKAKSATFLSYPRLAAKVSTMIPFQNSLLLGTTEDKVYRLSSTPVERLTIQGTIPETVFCGSNLKVSVHAEDPNGTLVALEDKIMPVRKTLPKGSRDHVLGHLFQVGDVIALPLDFDDYLKRLVNSPQEPHHISRHFRFINVQMLSPELSVPLVIDTIQSSIILKKKNAPIDTKTILALNTDAQLLYRPKEKRNKISIRYTGFGHEDLDRLLYPHGYQIGVSCRSREDIPQIFDSILLKVVLPEDAEETSSLHLKVKEKIYHPKSNLFWIDNKTFFINILKLYEIEKEKRLKIFIFKK